jgi:hypothetical protein
VGHSQEPYTARLANARSLAQVAQEAYSTHNGGITNAGNRIRSWYELDESARRRWIVAVEAVVNSLGSNES